VWWEKGFYPQEDEAVAEIIAAFELGSGKQVELVQPTQHAMFEKAEAALSAGQPPDFLFGTASERWIAQWAYENRLADLRGALGPVLNRFDDHGVEAAMLLNGSTGRRGLYALPMVGDPTTSHVWKSLQEPTGFTLADVPKEWDPFWSFWHDKRR
jgi:multiple sugar transport system substrate-binding protein